MQRYESIEARYEKAKGKLEKIEEQRQARWIKREQLDTFLTTLLGQDSVLTEFNQDLWIAVIDKVTVLNTGEFYGNGESEMVVGEALQGISRDSYFISVKFGMLPQPGGGLYGIDVNPWNVKAHLAYSLKSMNLDYIDLYQPARWDEAVLIEELIGALSDLVKEGYIKNIGLSVINAVL